jgi:hypothetical protein
MSGSDPLDADQPVKPFTIRCDHWKIPKVTSARPVGQCPNTLTAPLDELHQHAKALGWELFRFKQYCPSHASPLSGRAE